MTRLIHRRPTLLAPNCASAHREAGPGWRRPMRRWPAAAQREGMK